MPRYGIPCSRATWQARILPSQPREPKPAGHQHPVGSLELLHRLLVRHVLGVEPAHVHLRSLVHAGVLERLVHREVGVVQLHVLADERDLDVLAPVDDQVGEVLPLAEHGGRRVEAEPLADELVEALALEELRDQVDVGHVGRADHGLGVDVGEQRDLLADVVGEHVARAADDDVRVDTDAAQLVDRVLGRLRLQLAGGLDERHQRDVEVEDVLLPDLAPELADRLEERQRLDVADGAADLGDDDVGGLRDGAAPDARLDLVRDVRDHLHRRAEVVALALLAQHRLPDRAGAVARVAGEVLVDEALVVAEIEIGLGAVLGDEHLAVLERAHRAGVDVEVRVELLRLHAEPAGLQQAAERGGDDPLAERRDDAAGDEDVLRLVLGRSRVPAEPIESRGARASTRSREPRERRSPMRVRSESAPIAPHRLRPVSNSTEEKPSTAPSAFEPASPSIAISLRS